MAKVGSEPGRGLCARFRGISFRHLGFCRCNDVGDYHRGFGHQAAVIVILRSATTWLVRLSYAIDVICPKA